MRSVVDKFESSTFNQTLEILVCSVMICLIFIALTPSSEDDVVLSFIDNACSVLQAFANAGSALARNNNSPKSSGYGVIIDKTHS